MDPKKSKKIKIASISVLIAAAIILGTLSLLFSLGVIGSKNTVYSYGSTDISTEVYCYLASYYKMRFISQNKQEYGAVDTPEFWASVCEEEDGKTFGEILREGVDDYVKRIAVSAELYDINSGGISSVDKQEIENAVNDILKYRADGSKSTFNEMTEKYGFDFRAFQEATVLMYKSGYLKNVLYGYEGSSLYYLSELCDEYYNAEFARVLIVFIRTDTKVVTDEDGNSVTVPMTDEDVAKAEALVEEIASHADDDTVSEEYIRYCIEEYDESGGTGEYYFSIYNTAAYQYYTEVSEGAVTAALEMEPGELRVEDGKYGKHIVYKLPLTAQGYKNLDNEYFFEDFYKDAADYFTEKTVSEQLVNVTADTENLSKIDPVLLPAQSEFVAYL